jgi:hypothetical protein
MQIHEQARSLTRRSGEELLLMAISGGSEARRRIHKELDLRAALAAGRSRAGVMAGRPAARSASRSLAA